MIRAMVRVVRYSKRPKPKGCSRFAGLLARLIPASTSTDDSASERLFNASRIMAIELDIRPIAALAPQRATFAPIPTALARMMFLSLMLAVI